jgi:hypothetical protein
MASDTLSVIAALAAIGITPTAAVVFALLDELRSAQPRSRRTQQPL